jgi:hypothetical protein
VFVAVLKPITPVRDGIDVTECGLHPNVTIARLNRADRDVIRPKVERTAAFEIKTRMVPMTGQNVVLEAAALEREAHVRAAIVKCENAAAVVENEDRTVGAVHDEPPFRFQFLEAPCEHEFLVFRVHEHDSQLSSDCVGGRSVNLCREEIVPLSLDSGCSNMRDFGNGASDAAAIAKVSRSSHAF